MKKIFSSPSRRCFPPNIFIYWHFIRNKKSFNVTKQGRIQNFVPWWIQNLFLKILWWEEFLGIFFIKCPKKLNKKIRQEEIPPGYAPVMKLRKWKIIEFYFDEMRIHMKLNYVFILQMGIRQFVRITQTLNFLNARWKRKEFFMLIHKCVIKVLRLLFLDM